MSRPGCSIRIQVNSRAACTVRSAVGCAVIPSRWTNRVRTSMTKNTYTLVRLTRSI